MSKQMDACNQADQQWVGDQFRLADESEDVDLTLSLYRYQRKLST